jgi:hypothetical protein
LLSLTIAAQHSGLVEMRDSGDPVSPGQALAAARREAGLTVAEVSQKTRIREAIIRGIEHDDYSGCGGDFYARGHIRAMARAAGADPAPLIQEYDAVHREPGGASDSTDQFAAVRGPFEPPIAAPAAPTAAFGSLGNVQLVGEETYGADPDYQAGSSYPGEADAESYHPSGDYGAADPIGDYGASGPSGDYSAAGSYGTAGSYGVSDTYGAPDAYETPENYQGMNGPTAAYGGGAGGSGGYRRVDELARDFDGQHGQHEFGSRYDTDEAYEAPGEPPSVGGDRSWFLGLTEPPDTGQGQPAGPSGPARPVRPPRPATEPRRPGRWAAAMLVLLAALGLIAYLMLSSSGSTPSASSGSPTGKATTSHRVSHSPSPGHTSSPSHTAPPPPQVLHPVSAVAFGPSGAGQGDDPQMAGLTIDHAIGTFWETDWYATARFGNLQAGTGMLLDMGHPVTITGAQVTLGPYRGADLQLRAGSAATAGSLRTVASAFNVAKVVQLHTGAPVTARYVLIWFTKLPPNASGNFQARIYNIKVH